MIDIYQPNDVPRWRKRMDGYSELRRNILYVGGGTGFSKMSTFVNYDANTRVAVIARPPIGAGSGPEPCCCCECISVGGGAGPVCKFGTTPQILQIVASGITQPNCCFTPSGFGGSFQAVGPDPNGTWTASHPSAGLSGFSCCGWGSNAVSGGSVTKYSDGSCSTFFSTTGLSGGWNVSYAYVVATNKYYREVSFIVTDGSLDYAVFGNETEIFPETDCSQTVTLSNQCVCGTNFIPLAGAGETAIGTGGSVVISPA